MRPLNCIIIDDEEVDLLFIKEQVAYWGSLKLVGAYSNALECMEALRTNDIDLLLLDIDIPVINGVNFLKRFENPPFCIFVTSHPEYALEAFDLHVIDYLLKPVRKERFELAIKRALELFSIKEKALNYELSFQNETITIKEGSSINKILLDEIVYLEALTNYTKIVTNNKKYTTLMNLKKVLEEMPKEKFIRVHRSYAVAKNKIRSLQQTEIVIGEFTLPLGKTYKKDIRRVISTDTTN